MPVSRSRAFPTTHRLDRWVLARQVAALDGDRERASLREVPTEDLGRWEPPGMRRRRRTESSTRAWKHADGGDQTRTLQSPLIRAADATCYPHETARDQTNGRCPSMRTLQDVVFRFARGEQARKREDRCGGKVVAHVLQSVCRGKIGGGVGRKRRAEEASQVERHGAPRVAH